MIRHTLLLIKLAFVLALLPALLAGCLNPEGPGNRHELLRRASSPSGIASATDAPS
jgi:hypothetical protein